VKTTLGICDFLADGEIAARGDVGVEMRHIVGAMELGARGYGNAARGHSSRKALAFAHPTQKSSHYYQNLILVNSF